MDSLWHETTDFAVSAQVLMEVPKVSIPVCTTACLLKQMLCVAMPQLFIRHSIPTPFRSPGLLTVLVLFLDLPLRLSDLIQHAPANPPSTLTELMRSCRCGSLTWKTRRLTNS